MKLILQLMPATSGETLLFGEPVKRRERSVFLRIGAIIETPGFYPNLTGTENLEIFAKLRGTIRPDAVEHALQVVGLPYKDKKLFGEYSLGMKQRLGIANAIMHDPELLILMNLPMAWILSALRRYGPLSAPSAKKRERPFLFPAISFRKFPCWPMTSAFWTTVFAGRRNDGRTEKENQKYILLQVSDTAATARILEQQMALQVGEYSIQDTTSVKIFKTTIDREALVRNSRCRAWGFRDWQKKTIRWKDYFKKITGGEGIA